jgi:adenylosuccinate lyase
VKHDVIAFLTNVADMSALKRRFLHQGMTSSDVLDTCLAVQLARASDIIIEDLDKLLEVLKRRATSTSSPPTIGRSHGIHAEPVTFGLKWRSPTPSSNAAARAWSPRARRSPPAPSPAPSARSPISIRAWKQHVAEKMGLTSSRSRRR